MAGQKIREIGNGRKMVYPDYGAEVFEGGDILLRFYVPGSTFQPVYVVLAQADAEYLGVLIDKAVVASIQLLDAEAGRA